MNPPLYPWLDVITVPAFAPDGDDPVVAVMFDRAQVPYLVEGDRVIGMNSAAVAVLLLGMTDAFFGTCSPPPDGECTAECRLCGYEELDERWERLAGEEPGPRVIAIGWARHDCSVQTLTGIALLDDANDWRCGLCLRVVPAERVSRLPAFERGRISGAVAMVTGHECMGCGQDDASPWPAIGEWMVGEGEWP